VPSIKQHARLSKSIKRCQAVGEKDATFVSTLPIERSV
jgi:hypothetical protein